MERAFAKTRTGLLAPGAERSYAFYYGEGIFLKYEL